MPEGTLNEQGLAIRSARLARGMTQSTLAEAAGISEKTVRRGEGGERLLGESLQAMCSVLGLDPTKLRSETEMNPTVETDRRRQRIRVGALTAVATLSLVAASATAVSIAKSGGGTAEAFNLTFYSNWFNILVLGFGLANALPFFRPVREVLSRVPGLPALGRRLAFLEHYGIALTFILVGYAAATVLPFAVADGWSAYLTGGEPGRVARALMVVVMAPFAAVALSAMIANSDMWPKLTERRLAGIAKAG